MNGFWLALGFLSRVPVRGVEFTPAALQRGLFWFPSVGALLGVLWWATFCLLGHWCGPNMGALMLVLLGVLFTGALHLDGVADTFDGFSAASGGRERALLAMKDSRIGAHGAVALVLVLLGKFVAFQSLTIGSAGAVLLTAAVLPRFVCALVVAIARPARSDGLAVAFATPAHEPAANNNRHKSPRFFAGAGAVWLSIPMAVTGVDAGRWVTLLGAVLVALACGWILVRRCSTVFGGVTGDTHGALIEVCETVVLLSGAALGGR